MSQVLQQNGAFLGQKDVILGHFALRFQWKCLSTFEWTMVCLHVWSLKYFSIFQHKDEGFGHDEVFQRPLSPSLSLSLSLLSLLSLFFYLSLFSSLLFSSLLFPSLLFSSLLFSSLSLSLLSLSLLLSLFFYHSLFLSLSLSLSLPLPAPKTAKMRTVS